MKRPAALRSVCLAALLALAALPCGHVRATTYTWLGNSSVNWVDGANWQGGAIPPSDLLNTDLLFADSGGPYSVINSSYSIHSLSFASNANAFTFFNGPLTLGAGGLTQNAASAETFSAPVLLGANQTWSLASGTGALSFSGGVNTGTGSAAYALTINAASTTGSGNVLGGPITGGGSLTKTGAGTLTLMGASNFSATAGGQLVNVNAGTLAVDTGGSLTSSGYLTVNTGATLAVKGTGSIRFDAGRIDVSSDAAQLPAVFTLSDSGVVNTGTLNFGNAVATQSGGTLTVGGRMTVGYNGASQYTLTGGTLTSSLTQIGGNTGAAGTFVQTGGLHSVGTLLVGYVTGAGTYTLSGGVLAASAVSNGQNSTGRAGLGVLDFNGGTLQATASSATFLTQTTGTNGTPGGLSAIVQAGGARIDTNGFNVTVGQNLLHDTGGGAPTLDGGLTKLGVGTLTLTGTNTFTGQVNINGGTLAISSEAALGATGAGSGPVAIGGGGTLRFTGSTTLTRTYNLGVAALGVAGGNTLTFGSGATINGGFLAGPGTDVLGDGATLNAVTTLPGSTLTQGGGTTASLNNTTVRGTFNQTGGTANLNNALVLGSGQLNVGGTVNATGTEIQGVTTVNAGGTLANAGTSLYLTGGSRSTINAGGTLSAASGSSIELNGSQLVNNGTQQGALNVNYGSTAKGNGIFGDVNVGDGGQFGTNSTGGGGSLNAPLSFPVIRLTGNGGLAATNPALIVGPQPSATPGTTNVGSLTLHGGGLFNVRVQDATGAAGTGYDLTRASNTLTLAGDASPSNQIVIRLSSLNANGNPGVALNFDASQNYQFVLVQANGGIVGYQPGEFAVDNSGFANALGGGSFSVYEQGNNQLVLAFTAVPEPGTWTLVLCAAAGWMFHTLRARRRELAKK